MASHLSYAAVVVAALALALAATAVDTSVQSEGPVETSAIGAEALPVPWQCARATAEWMRWRAWLCVSSPVP
jgi:hypothetical protein